MALALVLTYLIDQAFLFNVQSTSLQLEQLYESALFQEHYNIVH